MASEGDGSDVVTLQPGAIAYRKGDPGDALYVVEEGEVELLDGARLLTVLGRGELFGEGAVLDGGARDHTARAVTSCRLVRIDGPTLAALVREQPDVALHMMRGLSRRLAAAYAAPPAIPAPAAEAPAVMPAVARPRLVHDSGAEFVLDGEGETMVGRSDRSSRFTPPIDLAPLLPVDAPRSVSRRHAVLLKDGGSFQVRELPRVANGTWVNGAKLAADVATPLAEGDVISFGPVKLVFRKG